jgi:hypothetical protein
MCTSCVDGPRIHFKIKALCSFERCMWSPDSAYLKFRNLSSWIVLQFRNVISLN